MLERAKRRTHRQVALFAILTLGPLITLTIFSLSVSTNGLHKEVDKRLEAVATGSATLIESNTQGFANVVESYGQRPSIVEAVADGKITPEEQAELEPVLDDLSRYHGGVTSVGIDSPQGKLLTSFPFQPNLLGLDFSSRDWFKGASASGRGYVSSAFVSPSQGPVLTTGVAAPIRSEGNGPVVGYIVAGYSLGGIEEHVLNVSKTLGVDLTVTDQQGTVVAQPGAAPTSLVSVADDSRVKAALTGGSGVSTFKKQDRTVLSAYAPVAGTGWGVVTEVPASAALSDVAATRNAIIGGGAFLGIVLIVGLVFMARTLQRRAEVEADLGVARDDAREASRLKSEFLANMSHEIRTPLNGVLGMTGLLLASPIDNEEREYAEMAQRSGESLLGIINDILDFSKIEAGRLELESVDFELRDVVESAVNMFGEQAAAKGIELTASIARDVPRVVSGDPTRLRQVLVNLVGNAMKFTQKGEINVSATSMGNIGENLMAKFEVTDTGPGITPEDYERLFESFTQADSSTTRQHGGTGLGLAISKQLVILMEGKIGVDSAVGKGSTFWFTLPLTSRPDDALPNELPRHSLAGSHVLVVDDNATNCAVLEGQLSLWGAIGTIENNGADALNALREAARREQPFVVALIDHQMPGMNGIELASEIRNDPEISGTHLVLLTSSQEYGSLRASREIGVNAYLTKPVRSSALYRCINTMIGSAIAASPSTTSYSETSKDSSALGTILIAEDNLVNQKVAKGMLTRMGFDVDLAANGSEAVEATTARSYDIILMEVQMPGMDGCEATRIIRESEKGMKRTPIIAMTAGVMKGDRERCLDAGMDDFVSKPVDWSSISDVFAQWIHAPVLPRKSDNSDETPVNELIDLRIVETLHLVADQDEVFNNLLGDFRDTCLDLVDQVKTCLDHHDTASASIAVHNLKGSCGTFGAVQLTQLSLDMEVMLREDRIEDVQKMVDKFKLVLKETEHAYAATNGRK